MQLEREKVVSKEKLNEKRQDNSEVMIEVENAS
jgi:hypothetical protein